MSILFYQPKVVSLPGSKLYFFQTATSTPQAVYTDEALTVPHDVPVTANSAGVFAPIYLDPTLPYYRVSHYTSADVLIYTVDNVPSNQNVQQSMRLESTNPFVFLYDTDGTSGSRKYRIRASGAAFEVQAANEAENSFSEILRHEGGLLFSNAVEVAVTSAGTFEGILDGFSNPLVSGTFNYRKVNNIAYVWLVDTLTGTSDVNTMTLSSALPVAIIPASAKICPCVVTDATSTELDAVAVVSAGGDIRFDIAKTNAVSNYVQFSSNGFTPSGTKGLSGGWMIHYPLL